MVLTKKKAFRRLVLRMENPFEGVARRRQPKENTATVFLETMDKPFVVSGVLAHFPSLIEMKFIGRV